LGGAQLIEDLGADSLDLVDIGFALEDHFGREINEADVERAVTVGDIISLFGPRMSSLAN
jgi:acyl carrier protein